MPIQGLPKPQSGGAVDFHIREKVDGLSKDGYKQHADLAGANANSVVYQEVFSGKYVPIEYRMAPNQANQAGKSIHAGPNKKEALPSGLSYDRSADDNFLTPDRKLPVGASAVQYGASEPANSSWARDIRGSLPPNTKSVLSGGKLQKGIPVQIRFNGSIMLQSRNVNKGYLGAVWLKLDVGSASLYAPAAKSLVIPVSGGNNIASVELSNLIASSMIVAEDMELDRNVGTDVSVSIGLGLKQGALTASNLALMSTYLQDIAKRGYPTEGAASATTAFGPITGGSGSADRVHLNMFNTTIDISQMSTGLEL